jgi:hypothetical protein
MSRGGRLVRFRTVNGFTAVLCNLHTFNIMSTKRELSMTNEGNRRRAMQLANQMPETPEDCRQVMEHLEWLLGEFLFPAADSPAGAQSASVVRLPRRTGG